MPSSAKASHVENRREAAASAVERLFKVCRLPDVADHKAFLVLATAIFAEFPVEIMNEVAAELPTRFKRPMLDDIRKACETAYEPIERRLMRDRVKREALPPPPAGPKLTKEEIEAKLGRRIGVPVEPLAALPPRPQGYASRALADIAARKAQREF